MAEDNILSLLDIAGLIYRQRSGTLTPIERTALDVWLADPANRALADELSRQEWVDDNLAALDPEALRASAARVYQALGMETPVIPIHRRGPGQHRSPVRRIVRWTAAAAVITAIATGAYLSYFRQHQPNLVQTAPALNNDLPAPTGTKTTLILANGQQLILDSLATGALAQQGNARVSKLDPHQLAYNTVGAKAKSIEVFYNTLSTARGGQTQVTLADGTKVWLNALSSLRFPTAFTGATREVELTGEAYFEVAHVNGQPFRVHAGKTLVEDIGTRFDVNAYADEPDLTATLLQGAVRVNGQTLAPGEQAAVTEAGQLSLRKGIDPDAVLGWKNGEFVFNRLDMAAVLRQVSRWYDVDIVPPAQPVHRTFSGIVSRNGNLADVMKILEGANIRFRLEGRKMILLQ
jgi:transmembrane sensor